MKEINKNIIMEKNRIFTVSEYNKSVYGEKIRNYSGKYLREWNPKRSKLAAAIIKGLKEIPLNKNTNVLYLGASTGTTVSHISDICYNGRIFAVEFAYDPFVKLYNLAKIRSNIFPILDDANMPEKYRFLWIRLTLYIRILPRGIRLIFLIKTLIYLLAQNMQC